MGEIDVNGFVATDKPKINTYVSKEINQAIEKEMAKERRSKSQMVELLVEEALKNRGYQFSEQEGGDNV
jgi:hypothetical protein